MPFEYHNPHPSAMECVVGRPIGSILIESGAVVPTPEMEAKGVTKEVLEAFACSNLLHPTPPVVRRRFLEEADLEVPADLVAATQHLPEFGGAAPPPVPVLSPTSLDMAKARPVAKKRQTRHQFTKELESALGGRAAAPSIGNPNVDTQSLADAKCSSTKPARPVDPDSPSGGW